MANSLGNFVSLMSVPVFYFQNLVTLTVTVSFITCVGHSLGPSTVLERLYSSEEPVQSPESKCSLIKSDADNRNSSALPFQLAVR
jgi:hypothetical protein